ncbi:hypothetical protein Maq22A_c00610 [Methylobacterium aquaticum]|uniref:Uncharacterized protein n=1 Tax=Methylobacterium aquaticum TaxID=270351 RepID=A0A0C6FLZ2_9HYPH|nr:hypothetical protein Maq22A_c00610 [Methylobacterium aquaticum]
MRSCRVSTKAEKGSDIAVDASNRQRGPDPGSPSGGVAAALGKGCVLARAARSQGRRRLGERAAGPGGAPFARDAGPIRGGPGTRAGMWAAWVAGRAQRPQWNRNRGDERSPF